VNHAEPHETSRPAQGLRCSWTVLTARENETNTSGFTTVLETGLAGCSLDLIGSWGPNLV
jgi:hypothetical protein